jgi:hypothetical protein
MPPFTRAAAAGSAALLAALPLLAGCGTLGQLGASPHNQPAKSFTVPGPVSAVVIHGGSGSIDVTGSSRSTVHVSQQVSYSKTPPNVTHSLRGGTLNLSYSCPVELVCSVSYDVQVPRGVAVTVSAGAGSITLTSLDGPVSARASAGLITANGLRSATASFTSNAGAVLASFTAAPRSLTANTNVGPITLTVPGSAAYRVSTHTFVGTATVTVHRSGSSAHSISAKSDLGSISISPG